MVKPTIKKQHPHPHPINPEEEELKQANRIKALISQPDPEAAKQIEDACNKVAFYSQKVEELDKEYQEKLATVEKELETAKLHREKLSIGMESLLQQKVECVKKIEDQEKTIDLLMKIKNGYEYVLSLQPLYVGMTKEEFKDALANFIENHDQMREESNIFYIDQAMHANKILGEFFKQDKPKVENFHQNMGKLSNQEFMAYVADQQQTKEKLLRDLHDLYFQGQTAENSMLTKEEFKKIIFQQIKLNRGDVNIELEKKYKELEKMMKEKKNIPKERLDNVVELLKHLDETITEKDREEAAKKEAEPVKETPEPVPEVIIEKDPEEAKKESERLNPTFSAALSAGC